MRTLLHPSGAVRDALLLLARVLLGVVLIAHGWQKFSEWTLSGTAANFDQMGIPLSTVSAWFAAVVELVGGVLLVLGALTPVVGILVALNMAGAWWFVHKGSGVFVADGGWELVAVIAAGALALAGAGAGHWSVDGLLARGHRTGGHDRDAATHASAPAGATRA